MSIYSSNISKFTDILNDNICVNDEIIIPTNTMFYNLFISDICKHEKIRKSDYTFIISKNTKLKVKNMIKKFYFINDVKSNHMFNIIYNNETFIYNIHDIDNIIVSIEDSYKVLNLSNLNNNNNVFIIICIKNFDKTQLETTENNKIFKDFSKEDYYFSIDNLNIKYYEDIEFIDVIDYNELFLKYKSNNYQINIFKYNLIIKSCVSKDINSIDVNSYGDGYILTSIVDEKIINKFYDVVNDEGYKKGIDNIYNYLLNNEDLNIIYDSKYFLFKLLDKVLNYNNDNMIINVSLVKDYSYDINKNINDVTLFIFDDNNFDNILTIHNNNSKLQDKVFIVKFNRTNLIIIKEENVTIHFKNKPILKIVTNYFMKKQDINIDLYNEKMLEDKSYKELLNDTEIDIFNIITKNRNISNIFEVYNLNDIPYNSCDFLYYIYDTYSNNNHFVNIDFFYFIENNYIINNKNTFIKNNEINCNIKLIPSLCKSIYNNVFNNGKFILYKIIYKIINLQNMILIKNFFKINKFKLIENIYNVYTLDL